MLSAMLHITIFIAIHYMEGVSFGTKKMCNLSLTIITVSLSKVSVVTKVWVVVYRLQ